MHLEPDTCNGNSSLLEIFQHAVDCVRLSIHTLGSALIVKKQRLRVRLVRPTERLFHVGVAFVG